MKTTRPADIVRLVRDRRGEVNLTQQQVAERAGVTRQLVARLENGVGDPALSTVLRVLDALDIELRAEVQGAPRHEQGLESTQLASLVPGLDVSALTSLLGESWAEVARSLGSDEQVETAQATVIDQGGVRDGDS